MHVGLEGNAWAIAGDLENGLEKWFGKTKHNRRDQLCGGPDEVGSGMEMWRRLYLEFEEGSELVEYAGRRGFNKYPRCTGVAKLHQHLMNGSTAC